MLYKSTVLIRAYFGVFADIALMWVTVAQNSITPGLEVCEQLNNLTLTEEEMVNKQNQLSEWADKAKENVKKVAKDVSAVSLSRSLKASMHIRTPTNRKIETR
jgi:hypothetical protein